MKTNKTESSQRPQPRTFEAAAERRQGAPDGSHPQVKNEIRRDGLVLRDTPLSVQQDEDTFNPYDRRPAEKTDARPVKRDLRKLSEWIKTLRAIEERKARGED